MNRNRNHHHHLIDDDSWHTKMKMKSFSLLAMLFKLGQDIFVCLEDILFRLHSNHHDPSAHKDQQRPSRNSADESRENFRLILFKKERTTSDNSTKTFTYKNKEELLTCECIVFGRLLYSLSR